MAALAAYVFALTEQTQIEEARFKARSNTTIQILRQTVENNAISLNAMKAYYSVTDDVDIQAFKKVSAELLADHPSILVYIWLPKVEQSGRLAFETKLEELHPGNPVIRSGNGFGDMKPSESLNDFYPVLYAHPLAAVQHRLGLDVSSLPRGGPALEASKRSKTLTASAPINRPEEFGENAIIMLFNPVPEASKTPSGIENTDFRGVIMALFEVGTVIGQQLPTDSDIKFYVKDITDAANPIAVYGLEPTTYKGRVDETISFAGRKWNVTSTTQYKDAHFKWVAPLIFIIGALLSAVLALTLMSMINRRIVLEELVNERTDELSQAVQKLSESNGNLERFAQNCSHDLQAPLRQVGSFADLLRLHISDKLESDEEGKLYLNKVLDGTSFAQKLVADILAYSSAGKGGIRIDDVDVNSLVDLIKENRAHELKPVGGTITSDALPVIRGNKSAIFQLLQNLISNGLKYRAQDTKPNVHISAKDKDSHWEFSITDNGIGIEAEHLSKVFEVFERLHRKDYKGNGIGLPICQKVVESHGGEIWVESEPGQGSTFFFTLSKSMA